jgi:hypothetical protein
MSDIGQSKVISVSCKVTENVKNPLLEQCKALIKEGWDWSLVEGGGGGGYFDCLPFSKFFNLASLSQQLSLSPIFEKIEFVFHF